MTLTPVSDLLKALRVLDLEYREVRTRLDVEHREAKLKVLAELVEETGSVTGACRVLGITRARWYQITRGEVPSPWEPPRN